MTTVAELYAQIGLKGGEKSLADVLGVKQGLTDTKAAALDVNSVLANFGIKNIGQTGAVFTGWVGALEELRVAAHSAHEAVDEVEAPPPDDQLTMLADMRESLSQIAATSKEAGTALSTVKPKDSEKTKKELDGFKKGLKDVSSMSFEAKAAILGAMYALERLFSTSGQAGTNLTNFNATLGVSAQTLQQYQYAARQVGASNQDVEATFRALQATMTNTLLGKGAPESLARVAQLTGDMGHFDIEDFSLHPEKLIQRFQEYAKKETNAGLFNKTMSDFGVSAGVAAAIKRQAFKPEIMAKAPTYSDSEIKQLDKVRAQISNLETKIEMAVGHFTSAHGGQLVGDISKLVDKVLDLANAFATLAEKAKIFELIGKIFGGWTSIVEGATKAADAVNDTKKRDKMAQDFIDFFQGDIPNWFKSILDQIGSSASPPRQPGKSQPSAKTTTGQPGLHLVVPPGTAAPAPRAAAPSMPAGHTAARPAQNVEFNQTLNFQDSGVNPKKVGEAAHSGVDRAYRQLGAQGQGS